MLTDEEVRSTYGQNVAISRKDAFVLVHLDNPSKNVIRERTRTFNPSGYFVDDCPLCQMMKAGGIVVYDEGADG